MDVVGEIVERETAPAEAPAPDGVQPRGFPELYRPAAISSWRQRLQKKNGQRRPPAAALAASEAEKIHKENMAYIEGLSEEQRTAERRELLESLDPKVVQALYRRLDARAAADGTAPLVAEVEGAAGTWVGGTREEPMMPRLDDATVDAALGAPQASMPEAAPTYDLPAPLEDADDIAPQEYQFIQQMDHMKDEDLLRDIHFVRNETVAPRLDINDPNFDEQLHEKYFPDLPKEIDKLEWMRAAEPEQPLASELSDVAECRFDFKGHMVPPHREVSSTQTGLHHHSENPHLAGYTIPELQHLSRSTFPAQRCIAIQTLGRILYKLGKQSYYQLVPSVDAELYQEEGGVEGITSKIYYMFWDLVKSAAVIEALQLAADERTCRHLSVRNYAIDALWLWRHGGGDPRTTARPTAT
ncbi:AFR727Wp [Eremothecium gossypii ATCC 10895]|uniref:AFR727Wp n=1 Tax=Eremothecium gossypii (strain ATCC 10895 / CBS 109.51 / FGSC 9923 / NRRL Y-1056) TaxID=284811 RepID=Q751U8_EREGS|nr:AFR727Wp [Eremothecium gossypii ATCC 10895]AAS54099.2 AFR727Wp [Eremothecium gossypii ATCC 10895]AEY98415.1 FAFR727Wp [Eremothecium gossypii FDAG1]